MLKSTAERDVRWLSLVVLCIGMLMIVVDGTVVNIALPSIQSDLGFSQSALAWVVNAYLIAFGGLLLLAGRVGDLIGARRVFIAGLVVFTLASLACGIAWNQQMLIAARFLQGIGGAMASSVILAMIVKLFPAPLERAKAMGVFSFTASAGGSVGLLVGGTMTQLLNWHWVFLINVPIGIVTFFFARKFLHANKGLGLRAGADALGAVLITACLMIAVYTVVEIPIYGLSSAHTLVCGAAAVALFIGFIIRQVVAEEPLLQLGLFRSRNITGTNALQVLLVAGLFGFFFLDSLFFRRVLGYGAVATGLAFLPVTLSIGALSLGWSASLANRFGARRIVTIGPALAAVGLGIFAVAPLDGNYMTTIFPAMLLLGVGMGIAFPPLMMFAMSDADEKNAGLVSGLVNTTAQVGGAFGLAILATAAASRSAGALAGGASTAAALGDGYHFAFGIAAVCLGLAAVIAATVLRPIGFEDRAGETRSAAAQPV